MANVFNSAATVFIIDTAANADAVAELAGMAGNVKIKSIRWVGGESEGDTVVVMNLSSDTEIWSSVSDGPDWTDELLYEDWVHDGFRVTTLDSGKLYVELR